MSDSAALLEDVSLSFGDRYALRHVHLRIGRGETVALIGPNGAGKTTLLRLLATLIAPTSGNFALFGQTSPEDRATFRRRIGALFVEGFLYGELSVRENLVLYSRLYGLQEPEKVADRWIERVGMGRFSVEPVRNLSRGERQRVAVARSLLHEPTLLLWDEPTTGLDDRARKLLSEMARERKGDCTIVCATHDLPGIEGWIQRTVSLVDGRIP